MLSDFEKSYFSVGSNEVISAKPEGGKDTWKFTITLL
jgi:hypothetical protein